MRKSKNTDKKERFDAKNLKCNVCKTTRGLIHKYGLHICRRCFREDAPGIGFKKYS
ncbi:30S ribosomal protein S14 [Candidatus Altiarchaeota archaeon]